MIVYAEIDKSKIHDGLSKYFDGDYKNHDAVNGLCAFCGAGVKDVNLVIRQSMVINRKESSDFSSGVINIVNHCIDAWRFWEEIVSKKHVFGGMSDAEIVKLIVDVMENNTVKVNQATSSAICDMVANLDGEGCEIDYDNDEENEGEEGDRRDGESKGDNDDDGDSNDTRTGRGKSLTDGNKKRIKAISELPPVGFWNRVLISEIAVNLKYTTSELFTGYSSIAQRDRNGNQFVVSQIRHEDELAFVSPEDMADPSFLVNLANDDVEVFANALYKKPKQRVFLALDSSGSMREEQNSIYGLAYVKEFVDRLKDDKCELWFGWHGRQFDGFERIEKDEADDFFNNALEYNFSSGTNYTNSISGAIKEVEAISKADDHSIYEIVYIGDSDDTDINFERLKELVGKCKFNYIHISKHENSLEGLSKLAAFTGGKCIVHKRIE